MDWCSYPRRHQHQHHHHHHAKCASMRLENIEEERPASCLPVSLRPPETPTEAMEFLARSWSLSAVEISKALTLFENRKPSDSTGVERQNSNPPLSAAREEVR
ncbi:Plant pleckstrin region [Musa troglodytarum]|uniref:Plant pleckstrin region n=1 Tax=Musa troglodytarum TaxID=320322 RepID=A0A9E7I4U1_9LILI|nr:Plant pleckstrin region [Musa troglodytarum]